MTPCRLTNVFVVTLLACSGAKPTKSSDAGVNDDQARQHRFEEAIQSPLEYLTDIRKSEDAAQKIQLSVLKSLCSSFTQAKPPKDRLTHDFLGRWPSKLPNLELSERVITAKTIKSNLTVYNATAFSKAIEDTLSRWIYVQRCGAGLAKFKLLAKDDAWGIINLSFSGQFKDDRIESFSSESRVRFRYVKDKWLIRAFDLGVLQQVSSRKPLFVNVARETGVSLRRSKRVESAILAQRGARTLETIGGVAVFDHNRDGRDDFAAWNHKRTLQIFVNDGVAGFDRIMDPIPAKHVGLFQLFIDLDGDQIAEIVSTEIASCQKGIAEFPVYKRRGKRYRRQRGVLKFRHTCEATDQVKFQSIAVADVNRDGHLDLFFSGFSHRHSKGLSHNRFRSTSGEANRLFMGRGKLRFSEEAKVRGLSGHSFSYAASFLDYDHADGPDLYVVNDYGRNVLYLNNGEGHFKPANVAIAKNGQSMGVSHVDINGDGELDLYVSNMYSKAGNRIVPLAKAGLQPETYAELLQVAQGNNAFIRQPNGGFVDKAKELSIAKGGWAWGHVFFDADLDGDRDLYVVNGNLTHLDTRAPDY